MEHGDVKMRKNICVIDTCSIVVLIHLGITDVHLGGLGVRKRIDENFIIFTPDYIADEEIKGSIRKYELDFGNEAPKDFLSNIKVIHEDEYKHCLDVIYKWADSKSIELKEKDEGELRCLALSLYLSRNRNDNIFLISDDKKARNKILDEFVENQKIGFSYSFPDLILHMFFKINIINRDHVLKTFHEYYRVLPARTRSVDMKRQQYQEWLRNACREFGSQNKLCRYECFY